MVFVVIGIVVAAADIVVVVVRVVAEISGTVGTRELDDVREVACTSVVVGDLGEVVWAIRTGVVLALN